MTYLLTVWTLLLVTLEGASGCINDDGNFSCATKWYFWLGLFAGLLVLFFIIACLCNHYCKKPSNGLATPRVLSAIERQKNRKRASVRPVSNMWYSDGSNAQVHPANQQPGPVVHEQLRDPPVTNLTTTSGPTVYPNSTTVIIQQSHF